MNNLTTILTDLATRPQRLPGQPRSKQEVLADRIAVLNAHVAALRGVLGEAMLWDGADDEGVPAVWLDEASKALRETTP